MKIVIGFILEYLLILKIHILSLGRKIPNNWEVGDKGEVILIQGFGETWCFLENIGYHLNQSGYRVHTIPEFSYNTLSIDECVKVLGKFIDQKNLKKVILVSHSKGGIIAKRYMDTDSHGANIMRSFSIASPYQGTIWGYLYFFNLIEVVPGSQLIRDLLSNTTNIEKIVNIHAKWDNHVIPNKNAVLPGATNKQIDVIGHTRVIESKETLGIINKYL